MELQCGKNVCRARSSAFKAAVRTRLKPELQTSPDAPRTFNYASETGLGARLDALSTKYQSLQKLSGEQGETPSLSELFEALKDLSGLVVEAKRAQVAALNQKNYSLQEYEWTRRQIYQAAGIPIDGTFQQIIRDASTGKVPDFEKAIVREPVNVPERNKELVAPHANELIERSALAFFGL
ncbi:MAG: hypothetical protein ACREIA_04455 [Opitutaceae bacterium]